MEKNIRRKTKVVKVGNVLIGGSNPIAIQSMTKSKTSDIVKTVQQIINLEKVGCEIIRLAVKDFDDAKALAVIKAKTNIPIVADIHFDWRLAVAAIESGVDKIRLNPGNIKKQNQIREVVLKAKKAGIPIRIGLNSGSIGEAQDPIAKMVKAAQEYIKIFEKNDFDNIVVSLKAADVFSTVRAYREMSKKTNYPLHLGVTATGLPFEGMIKSTLAIGSLLMSGIGDTIRVSLTDKSEEEIKVGKALLKSLDLRSFGPQIISCPTCGRCEVDLVKIVKDFEKVLSSRSDLAKLGNIKVAIMGCVVNGPGEAKNADLGIAFGKDQGLLFKKGKAQRKVPYSQSIKELVKELELLNV